MHDENATLPWLRSTVREVLRLPENQAVDAHTLRDLGARSIHVVTLQYKILQETSVDVEMAEMVGSSPVLDLATLIDGRRAAV